MSASLNTGETRDDKIVLTASSHVTSPIHPPRGVAEQFYWAAVESWGGWWWLGGGFGRALTRHLLIRVRQGVSLHKPEIQQTSSSYLCLWRRLLCVYWLGTTWHWVLSSKCRFTKGWAGAGEVCVMHAVWICWCRPDRCCRYKKRPRHPARSIVSPRELSPQSTLADKAALRHVESKKKDWTTIAFAEHKQMFAKWVLTATLDPQSSSLHLFVRGAELLRKGAKVMNFPCEATISINSGYTRAISFKTKMFRFIPHPVIKRQNKAGCWSKAVPQFVSQSIESVTWAVCPQTHRRLSMSCSMTEPHFFGFSSITIIDHTDKWPQ